MRKICTRRDRVGNARERSKEHRLDGGEHGGVHPDAESEREDRDSGEERTLAKESPGVAEVVQEGGHQAGLTGGMGRGREYASTEYGVGAEWYAVST